MNGSLGKLSRCAVYTRKSTEHNLDLAFTSLDAQREACEAYIKSQAGEGWRLVGDHYDDGAFSGASLERPALQRLLADVRGRRTDSDLDLLGKLISEAGFRPRLVAKRSIVIEDLLIYELRLQ
jgi:hypothetical protein